MCAYLQTKDNTEFEKIQKHFKGFVNIISKRYYTSYFYLLPFYSIEDLEQECFSVLVAKLPKIVAYTQGKNIIAYAQRTMEQHLMGLIQKRERPTYAGDKTRLWLNEKATDNKGEEATAFIDFLEDEEHQKELHKIDNNWLTLQDIVKKYAKPERQETLLKFCERYNQLEGLMVHAIAITNDSYFKTFKRVVDYNLQEDKYLNGALSIASGLTKRKIEADLYCFRKDYKSKLEELRQKGVRYE